MTGLQHSNLAISFINRLLRVRENFRLQSLIKQAANYLNKSFERKGGFERGMPVSILIALLITVLLTVELIGLCILE